MSAFRGLVYVVWLDGILNCDNTVDADITNLVVRYSPGARVPQSYLRFTRRTSSQMQSQIEEELHALEGKLKNILCLSKPISSTIMSESLY